MACAVFAIQFSVEGKMPPNADVASVWKARSLRFKLRRGRLPNTARVGVALTITQAGFVEAFYAPLKCGVSVRRDVVVRNSALPLNLFFAVADGKLLLGLGFNIESGFLMRVLTIAISFLFVELQLNVRAKIFRCPPSKLFCLESWQSRPS